MKPRTLDAPAYARLKTATHALIRRAGGLEAAATVCRSPVSRLSDFQNAHKPDSMPADVIADLEHVVGEPVVTSVLASLAGCALIPLNPPGEGNEVAAIAVIGRDSSALFASWCEGMGDGVMTPDQRGRVQNDLARLHRATAAAMALLQGRG